MIYPKTIVFLTVLGLSVQRFKLPTDRLKSARKDYPGDPLSLFLQGGFTLS